MIPDPEPGYEDYEIEEVFDGTDYLLYRGGKLL
jgi:hypothetical protein